MEVSVGRRGLQAAALAWGVVAMAAASRAAESVGAADAEQPAPFAIADVAGAGAEEPWAAPIRLSMDFQEAQLGDVLKSFSLQTGINVIASAEIAGNPVTVYFEDVEALDALDQILAAGNLVYERPPGSHIYVIRPKPQEDAPQTLTRVYRLRYGRVSESIFAKAAAAFGDATPFEASKAGGESQGSSGVSASDEGVGIDTVVKELLTEEGQVVVDGRTNSLIVTDVASNFPRLEAAIAALDVPTPQILVDAEIIETTVTKLKDLGFEWGGGTEGTLVTYRPSVLSLNSFPLSLFKKESVATEFDLAEFDGTVSRRQQAGFALLDMTELDGVLQALETDTDTRVLARPKVLTLDNESAVIRLTSDETTGFKVTASGTGSSAQREVEPIRQSTGVIMSVTPQINDDGYITMLVEPSVTKTVTSKVTPPADSGTVRDPKTRSSRTVVRIRSGDTLVVGGLIDRSDEETIRRVPGLSGIPFLGEMFKNVEVNNASSELVVFITPTILREGMAAQVASAVSPASWGAAQAGAAAPASRAQEGGARQETIEDALNRLERPSL
jgi:type IV pilus secretin PilQ/predicted competence protein